MDARSGLSRACKPSIHRTGAGNGTNTRSVAGGRRCSSTSWLFRSANLASIPTTVGHGWSRVLIMAFLLALWPIRVASSGQISSSFCWACWPLSP
jgi:hypothetical protein